MLQPDATDTQTQTDTMKSEVYQYVLSYAPRAQERKVTINTASQGFTFSRRIGGTTFKVNVKFDPDAKDTMEDKIMRLIQNEAVQATGKYDIMPLQPMSRQSERSA